MRKFKVSYGVKGFRIYEDEVLVDAPYQAEEIGLFCAKMHYRALEDEGRVPTYHLVAAELYPNTPFMWLTSEQECEVTDAYTTLLYNSLFVEVVEI